MGNIGKTNRMDGDFSLLNFGLVRFSCRNFLDLDFTDYKSQRQFSAIIHLHMNKILCFLFLATLTLTATLLQADVDTFIRSQNLVPKSASLKTFSVDGDKATATYGDQFTTYKFVIGQDQQGKPYVVFRQQMTEINISSGNIQNFPEMNFMLPPPPMMIPMPQIQVFSMPQMPMIPVPLGIEQKFDHQMLSGNKRSFFENRQRGHMRDGQKRPCRLDQEDVKTLLKQNLVIFKDAEVKTIKKVGFERQNGIILQIILENDGKQYKINAGYMPRWRKINVIRVEEATALKQQTPLETGKTLIGKVLDQIPQKTQNLNMGLENLIHTFVEKLLVRKNVGNSVEQTPVQAPFLLGSQGQPERQQIQVIKPTQEPAQEPVQQPLLLGKQGQPQNPFKFQEQKSEQKQEQVHHSEKNSEQISQLVTQVISKLKLKTK